MNNSIKRVGLLTMHRVVNCGSQLQTYALYKKICDLGYGCEVIDYEYPALYHYSRKMGVGDRCTLKGMFKRLLSICRLLRVVQRISIWRYNRSVSEQVRVGMRGIKLSRHFDIRSVRRNPPQYDIYLTGSDQVWNPGCIVGDWNFLLAFVPIGAKKIAYSSSFGVNALPKEVEPVYAKWLAKFDAIGVREPSGVEIVRGLTGKDAFAVLDPTMLLTKKEWNEYASERRLFPKAYLFLYVLSYVFKASPWIMGYARKIADILGCEVVFYGGGEPDCIEDARAFGFHVLPRYISPQDFLRYYIDAEFIVATGFHGTAFAITLEKEFSIVTNPLPTKDDRVSSLLVRLGLDSHAIACGSKYDCLMREDLFRLNKDSRDEFHRQLRESHQFLKKALAGHD